MPGTPDNPIFNSHLVHCKGRVSKSEGIKVTNLPETAAIVTVNLSEGSQNVTCLRIFKKGVKGICMAAREYPADESELVYPVDCVHFRSEE